MTISPFAFGGNLVDNVDTILASHVNNLRAWIAYTAALGRNANTETLAANKTLVDSDEPIQFIDPSASEYSVSLPDVGNSNHVFYFINTSATYSLVVNSGATEIASIEPGLGAVVVSDGSTWKNAASGGGGTPDPATQIDESGGATLDIGAIADGEYLKRSGTGVVGDSDVASKTQSKSVSIHFPSPTVGDGAYPIDFPAEMNGWELTDVHAYADTAPSGGPVTIQVRNATDSVDVLSTVLTIEDGENDSNNATTQPVINTANDDVDTDDIWWIDFDAVNDAEDVVVRLTFTGDMS